MQSTFIYFCLSLFQIQFVYGAIKNTDTLYTEKEVQALTQLRTEIQGITYRDYQNLDSYLIHFLRRKNLNVDEAKKLIESTFKWRKDNNIDGILQEKEMVNLEKRFPITVDGQDKFGRPILSYIVHKWDVRRYLLAGNIDKFRRYQIYIIEKVHQRLYDIALSGKNISQYIVLIDMSNQNLRQQGCLPCLQALSDFVPLLANRYLNTANEVIFVNAPRSFETLITIVKGLLPQSRRNIFRVFGYDKNEWRAHLSKTIDDDQITTAFGGTRQVQL